MSRRSVRADTRDVEKITHRRPATVLLVEDDLSLQALAAHTLRSAGYHVIPASDIPQALQAAEQQTTGIDLILTDINLPSGNGMALAAQLVATRPNVPVLYMSGLTGDAIQNVQHEGAPEGSFIAKPFSPKALVALVQEMLPAPVVEATPEFIAATVGSDPQVRPASAEAMYRLESPVRCPQCGETISTLRAIRLLRAEVNFTSTLPRRGRILVCPSCQSIVPAELTNF
jgi:DNA-binding response OmpR family regulator